MRSESQQRRRTDMAAKSVVRRAGDGERRWFYGGGLHTWKVTSEESDGAFFLFEDELTQGKMTPWHCHPDSDEAIYVLEGETRRQHRRQRAATDHGRAVDGTARCRPR